MSYWHDIWRTVRGADTSTCRDAKGKVQIRSGVHFKGMSLSKHEDIVEIINNEQKNTVERMTGVSLSSVAQVRDSVKQMLEPLSTYGVKGLGSGPELVKRVTDSFNVNLNGVPGIPTPGYNLNTAPEFGGMTTPNLWIDPGEAAIIYASGRLPKMIIDKKSKSIHYNGVRLVNPKLSAEQLERVNESALKTGLSRELSNAARDGLTYGGSIIFPMFKHDVPATLLMNVDELAALGVIGKGTIDRYVVLDRNNAIHIPNWNPTAADFLNPRFYFIPYLGSDVNGQRIARIVPLPQAGYWGAIMTMGWGVSDIQGWFRSVCNYDGVSDAVPTMIRQMSILIHTYNIDLSNATNGAASLKDMEIEDTVVIHRASNENPISMDIIGDLKAVDRDFTAVAELTRIVRQDVGMASNLPEEEFWSSDRGAFASGDPSAGVNERKWEGMKYLQGEIQSRCKNIAMLEVINALGKDADILRALPYTRIEFLPQKIENAENRAELVGKLTQAIFDLVASGMKLDSALEIVLPYGDEHLAPKSEVLAKIKEKQEQSDTWAEEDHKADLALKQKQIDAPDPQPGMGGGGSSSAKPKEKAGYTRLEQRQHERTRGDNSRREGIQRARGKAVK